MSSLYRCIWFKRIKMIELIDVILLECEQFSNFRNRFIVTNLRERTNILSYVCQLLLLNKSYMLSHSNMEDMQFFFGMKNMRYQRNKDFKSFHLDVFDWLIVECVDRLEAINP